MASTIKYQGAFLAIVATIYGLLSLGANIYVGSEAAGQSISYAAIAGAGAILLIVAVMLTRMIMQYNVFGVATYLPAVLSVMLFAAVTSATTYIMSAVATMLVMLAIRNLNEAFSNVLAASKIFSAAIWIGILPLIYPPAIVMFLALAIGLLLYEREAREYVVMVCGLVCPALIAIYVGWLIYDLQPAEMINSFCEQLTRSSGWIENYSFEARSFSFAMGLVLTILSFLKISNLSVTSAARSRIFLAMAWSAVALLMLLIPSFEVPQLAIVTPAVAIVATSALITTRWWVSVLLFVIVMATAPLQIFW